MSLYRLLGLGLLVSAGAIAACSGSSSSSIPPSGQSGTALVRFLEGSPLLEALVGSVPQALGAAYLQVNGKTVASSFAYGVITSFKGMPAGTLSLVARDELGYAVGPLKSAALTGGKRYTLVLIGTYPNYSVLTFEEPPSSANAQLSLYEASPSVPQAAFGSFSASTYSDLKQLGTAALGNVVTVTLAKQVSNFGGYAATTACPTPPSHPVPPNCVTPSQINSFDAKNELPFQNSNRLSLFLLDPDSANPSGPPGPLIGSLDQ
jgi:hypothetical protein